MYWYSDWADQMEEISKGLPSALKAAYRSGEYVADPAMAARIAAHRSGQNYARASGAWRQSQRRVGESARAKSRAVLEPEAAPTVTPKQRARARLAADEVPASMRARRINTMLSAREGQARALEDEFQAARAKAKPTGRKSTSGWNTKKKIAAGVGGGTVLTGTAVGAEAHRRRNSSRTAA